MWFQNYENNSSQYIKRFETIKSLMGCFKPHIIFASGFTLRPCPISSARTCYTDINSTKMICFNNRLQNSANYVTMHNRSWPKPFKENFQNNKWGKALSFEELIISPFIEATTQIMGHNRFNYVSILHLIYLLQWDCWMKFTSYIFKAIKLVSTMFKTPLIAQNCFL